MSLRSFCGKRLVSISPERSIAEACWIMKAKDVGCLVVESQGKLCGILTDRDIALKVTGEERDPITTMVEVSSSSFIQLLIWIENASRKKRLQIKARRDNFKSQRMS